MCVCVKTRGEPRQASFVVGGMELLEDRVDKRSHLIPCCMLGAACAAYYANVTLKVTHSMCCENVVPLLHPGSSIPHPCRVLAWSGRAKLRSLSWQSRSYYRAVHTLYRQNGQ